MDVSERGFRDWSRWELEEITQPVQIPRYLAFSTPPPKELAEPTRQRRRHLTNDDGDAIESKRYTYTVATNLFPSGANGFYHMKLNIKSLETLITFAAVLAVGFVVGRLSSLVPTQASKLAQSSTAQLDAKNVENAVGMRIPVLVEGTDETAFDYVATTGDGQAIAFFMGFKR